MPFIHTVQADLLFKKLTGYGNKKISAPKVKATSFGTNDKEHKKEQMLGLNRMNFDQFCLAMNEIAQMLYSHYMHDVDQNIANRTEGQALNALIRAHLLPLDEGIQRTEKGNSAQTQIL
jgi:hypothetical protein